MKSLLLTGAVLALATTTPAFADYARYVATDDQSPIGQHVFDLQDNDIGRLEGFIDVYGTPGIIIDTNPNFGGRRKITQAQHLGWRAKGGLLLQLSDGSVKRMHRYDPPEWPLRPWW